MNSLSKNPRINPADLVGAPPVQTGMVGSVATKEVVESGNGTSSDEANDPTASFELQLDVDIPSAGNAITKLLNAQDDGAQVPQLEPAVAPPMEPLKEGEVRFSLRAGHVTSYAARCCRNIGFPHKTDDAELIEELTGFIKHIDGTIEYYEAPEADTE